MVGFWIMIIICTGLSALCILWGAITEDTTSAFVAGLLSCITGMAAIFFAAGLTKTSNPSPTPIDVYRGKTTLEITYKDSIPIDSVVVFKDKIQ